MAAKPNVHLLNFIVSSYWLVSFVTCVLNCSGRLRTLKQPVRVVRVNTGCPDESRAKLAPVRTTKTRTGSTWGKGMPFPPKKCKHYICNILQLPGGIGSR